MRTHLIAILLAVASAVCIVAGTGTNCVYSYRAWQDGMAAVVASEVPDFLPLVVSSAPQQQGQLGLVGTPITITTLEDLTTALGGFGSITPVDTLAAILTVSLLNIEKGAVPNADVIAAIVNARLIVYNCFTLTDVTWIPVVKGTAVCGELTVVDIATAMITLLQFNEGFLDVPLCPLAAFPTGVVN